MQSLEAIMAHVLEVLPNATVWEDADGQIQIATNLHNISSDPDEVVEFEE